jgi:hypothetical protein
MKHLNYLKYVLIHKWFVFIECCKLGIPLKGIIHDLSKFTPSEWFPYVNYFYGNYPEWSKMSPAEKSLYFGKTKEDIKKVFDLAWLYHQKRNRHHWQYWVLQKDDGRLVPLKMPLVYAKEMLADWIGAGLAITGERDINIWYEHNKNKIRLHDETRNWIEATISETTNNLR